MKENGIDEFTKYAEEFFKDKCSSAIQGNPNHGLWAHLMDDKDKAIVGDGYRIFLAVKMKGKVFLSKLEG